LKNVLLRSKTYATTLKDLFMFDVRRRMVSTHNDINVVLASPATPRAVADDLERHYNAMMTNWDEWAAAADRVAEIARHAREQAQHG